MAILLKIVGVCWAIIGAGNILVSPLLGHGREADVTFLLMFNVLLFILPGLVVYGIGSAIAKKPQPAKKKAPTMQCSFCAETINAKAIICRFCNKDIPEEART